MQQGMTDELYQHVHQYHDHPDFTPRERMAAELAEQFAIDHRGIDDAMWARASELFTDVELLEADSDGIDLRVAARAAGFRVALVDDLDA
jgi:alkylhydroperoxidase family enzyme